MRTGDYNSVYFSMTNTYTQKRVLENDSFTEMPFFNFKFRDFF